MGVLGLCLAHCFVMKCFVSFFFNHSAEEERAGSLH